MASKIVLGQRPQAFKPIPVKFTMPNGDPGVITATFAYKTRTEFAEVLNRIFADTGEPRPADEKVDFVALVTKGRERSNAELLAGLVGWDLDMPLGADTLAQLSDELPAATAALFTAWNGACTEGRLGNS